MIKHGADNTCPTTHGQCIVHPANAHLENKKNGLLSKTTHALYCR